jgi:hypothetical protein
VGLAQGDDGHATPPSSGGPGVTPVTAGQLHVDGDHGAKQVSLKHTGAAIPMVVQDVLLWNNLSCVPTYCPCFLLTWNVLKQCM